MAGKVVTAYLNKYGDQIMDSPEFLQAMNQRHHKRSSVGMHTMRVVAASIWVCYILSKLNVHTDSESVVQGALCHDLGILGRDDKFDSDAECYREHPMESVEVAERLLPELNERTRSIIRTHMWPVTPEAPTCKEGVIVSLADKVVAVRDFMSFGQSKYVETERYSAPVLADWNEEALMLAENRYSA